METNSGADLETWTKVHDLQLIDDLKLPNLFNSGRWKRHYNPNIFVSTKTAAQYEKR